MRYVSVKSIIDSAMQYPQVREMEFADLVDWTIETIREIGSPTLFEDSNYLIEVNDYRGKLPCDLLELKQASVLMTSDGGILNLTSGSGSSASSAGFAAPICSIASQESTILYGETYHLDIGLEGVSSGTYETNTQQPAQYNIIPLASFKDHTVAVTMDSHNPISYYRVDVANPDGETCTSTGSINVTFSPDPVCTVTAPTYATRGSNATFTYTFANSDTSSLLIYDSLPTLIYSDDPHDITVTNHVIAIPSSANLGTATISLTSNHTNTYVTGNDSDTFEIVEPASCEITRITPQSVILGNTFDIDYSIHNATSAYFTFIDGSNSFSVGLIGSELANGAHIKTITTGSGNDIPITGDYDITLNSTNIAGDSAQCADFTVEIKH